MINSQRRKYMLYSPSGDGYESLGEISAVVSHRSVEEAASEDFSRANESLVGIVEARYTPVGGFVRGMKLVGSDGGEYFVRMAKKERRLWCLYLSRFHYLGEG